MRFLFLKFIFIFLIVIVIAISLSPLYLYEQQEKKRKGKEKKEKKKRKTQTEELNLVACPCMIHICCLLQTFFFLSLLNLFTHRFPLTAAILHLAVFIHLILPLFRFNSHPSFSSI